MAPSSAGPLQAEAAPFVTGSGAASATVTKARLFYAGFSLQVPLGLSATTYENKQSRALGGAYDLTSATGLVDGVDQPQLAPISIDSNEGDATKTADVGAGAVLGRIALSARAVPSVPGRGAPGRRRPARARPHRGRSLEGQHRGASTATSAGRWPRSPSARCRSPEGSSCSTGCGGRRSSGRAPPTQADAVFTLASVSIGGVPIASDLHDLVPVFDADQRRARAHRAWCSEAPEVLHRDNGAVDMTALRIGLINSPLGAQVLGPLLAGVRPLLLPAFDALTDVDPTLGLAALVADLGLGVADGSGGIELSFGGATARTDDAEFADPLAVGEPAPTPAATPGTAGVAAEPRRVPGARPPLGCRPRRGRPASCPPRRPARPGACSSASPRRQGDCRGTNVPGAVAVVAIVVAGMAAWEAAARRRRAQAAAVGGAR